MFCFGIEVRSVALLLATLQLADSYYNRNFECGPYGFTCEGGGKLRLCEGDALFGPAFLCPASTVCNEDSSDVCENDFTYIEPSLSRSVRCRRNERIADPNVPDCKGYILCIPNKNRFQGIKFKCGGNTIFNGITRTCSSPAKYRCPLVNSTATRNVELYGSNRRNDHRDGSGGLIGAPHAPRPAIDCKNYKFTLTQDGPSKATYFCPQRPVRGERSVKCTVFSNYFCMTLDRDDEDQFMSNSGSPYRSPRIGL